MEENTAPPAADAPTETTTTLNTNFMPETPASEPSFIDSMPEAYREKDYLKNVTNMESFLDQYENAQKLIGKKQIPGKDSSPEEWTEFYDKVRPEKAEAYQFDYAEGTDINKEFETSVKGIFHEAGLNENQAKMIQSKYDELVSSMAPDPAAQDAEFDSMVNKHFGERQEEATRTAQKLLTEFAPADLQASIAELGNKELLLLTSVLDGVSNKYISEDRISAAGANTNTAKDSRTKARELMAGEAYKNAFHPDHLDTKAQVKALYESMN